MTNLTKTQQNTNQLWPIIQLIPRDKIVNISGVSKMPDPSKYYTILANQLEDYFNEFDNNLIVVFYYDFVISSSIKWLYFLLQHLEFLIRNGGSIKICWNFRQDNETIKLLGNELKAKTPLPFSLISTDI